MRIMTLDWKQFSEEAMESFQDALKEKGLYLGDLIEDCVGENNSDTYILYIHDQKLSRNEIKEMFPDQSAMWES